MAKKSTTVFFTILPAHPPSHFRGLGTSRCRAKKRVFQAPEPGLAPPGTPLDAHNAEKKRTRDLSSVELFYTWPILLPERCVTPDRVPLPMRSVNPGRPSRVMLTPVHAAPIHSWTGVSFCLENRWDPKQLNNRDIGLGQQVGVRCRQALKATAIERQGAPHPEKPLSHGHGMHGLAAVKPISCRANGSSPVENGR